MGISTHILDTSRGKPAAGVQVTLEARAPDGSTWTPVGEGVTDTDGRVKSLLPAGKTAPDVGTYRVRFAVGDYYASRDETGFYPSVSIEFLVRAPEEHYHVPLLLNPYGYSTYRGS